MPNTQTAAPIGDALIRTARARILSYETELSRPSHLDDPERRRLEKELADERNKLTERLSWLAKQ